MICSIILSCGLAKITTFLFQRSFVILVFIPFIIYNISLFINQYFGMIFGNIDNNTFTYDMMIGFIFTPYIY